MVGLNVRSPWSTLLIDGLKTVETRSYPLPKRLEGVELALIETPGKSAKFKSRIIGTITFSHSFQYKTENEWKQDNNRHKVMDYSNSDFLWNDKPKYGWVVQSVTKFKDPVKPPKKRGIVYAKNCLV